MSRGPGVFNGGGLVEFFYFTPPYPPPVSPSCYLHYDIAEKATELYSRTICRKHETGYRTFFPDLNLFTL